MWDPGVFFSDNLTILEILLQEICKSYAFRSRMWNYDLFSIIFSIQFWMEFYSVNNFILCGKYSFNFFIISYLLFIVLLLFESTQQLFLIPSLFYNLPRLSVVIFMYLLLRGTIRTFCKRVKDFLLDCTALHCALLDAIVKVICIYQVL